MYQTECARGPWPPRCIGSLVSWLGDMVLESERPVFTTQSPTFWLCEPRRSEESLITTVSLAYGGRRNSTYLMELFQELNEIMHMKHLAKCLECSKLPISGNYYCCSKLQLKLHFLPNTLQNSLNCEVPIITGRKKKERKQEPLMLAGEMRENSSVVCFLPLRFPLQKAVGRAADVA